MTAVIINPGTGALTGATKRRAVSNIRTFIKALGGPVECDLQPVRAYEGRWDFRLFVGTKRVEVSMPGVPLKQVRDSRSPWTPRLYVDGSSWYWPFALGTVNDEFGFKEAP